MLSAIRERIELGLRIDSSSKAVVYSQIYESAEIASLSYWLEVILSSGIATLGLVQNSPAVIIGAMLISPLMGPIMSTGLALAVGDLYLGFKSVLNLVLSILVSVLLAGLLVWMLPFHTATQEILSRIHPNLLDLGIAILSGLAGSMVVCCGGGGSGVMALPGVAIAVALMPPLCVVGFGLGSAFNKEIMYGASLLFLTNLVAIVSSAFVMFLIVRMDAPDLRKKLSESKHIFGQKELTYRLLQKSSVRGVFSTVGALRWRALMLAFLLAIVFVPLRSALIQVRNEAVTRTAVQEAVKRLVASESVIAQDVHYSPQGVTISVLSTQPISPSKIGSARAFIEKRAGVSADIQVQEVASRSELTDLVSRIAPPARPVAQEPLALTQIESDVLARLKPAITDLWPTGTPLLDYELGFAEDGPTVHLRYQATTSLDPFSVEVLQRSLQSRLALPNLKLDLEKVPAEASSSHSRPKK